MLHFIIASLLLVPILACDVSTTLKERDGQYVHALSTERIEVCTPELLNDVHVYRLTESRFNDWKESGELRESELVCEPVVRMTREKKNCCTSQSVSSPYVVIVSSMPDVIEYRDRKCLLEGSIDNVVGVVSVLVIGSVACIVFIMIVVDGIRTRRRTSTTMNV